MHRSVSIYHAHGSFHAEAMHIHSAAVELSTCHHRLHSAGSDRLALSLVRGTTKCISDIQQRDSRDLPLTHTQHGGFSLHMDFWRNRNANASIPQQYMQDICRGELSQFVSSVESPRGVYLNAFLLYPARIFGPSSVRELPQQRQPH